MRQRHVWVSLVSLTPMWLAACEPTNKPTPRAEHGSAPESLTTYAPHFAGGLGPGCSDDPVGFMVCEAPVIGERDPGVSVGLRPLPSSVIPPQSSNCAVDCQLASDVVESAGAQHTDNPLSSEGLAHDSDLSSAERHSSNASSGCGCGELCRCG